MLNILLNSSIDSLIKKLKLILTLNATDIFCTLILYSTGQFEEANGLLAPIINKPTLLILFKLIIPTILLLIVIKRIVTANSKQRIISNILIECLIAYYIFINLTHIVWSVFLVIATFM